MPWDLGADFIPSGDLVDLVVRRAAKVDNTQQEIVDAIRAEGWDVWIIKLPCDLFCWHPVLDVWQPLEVKSARKKDGSTVQDKRQEEQIKFLHRTRCPVVTTAQEALEALNKHYPWIWLSRLDAAEEVEISTNSARR